MKRHVAGPRNKETNSLRSLQASSQCVSLMQWEKSKRMLPWEVRDFMTFTLKFLMGNELIEGSVNT